MKPLVVMTVHDRADSTLLALDALAECTDLSLCETVVVDDASTDGAAEVVDRWCAEHEAEPLHLETNRGTARALNAAIYRFRVSGQPLVKLDNDVTLMTDGWLPKVAEFIAAVRERDPRLALVRASRVYKGKELPGEDKVELGKFHGEPFYHIRRHLGYSVWYCGWFMNRVRYFEPLSPNHIYGYDDVIMGHKASAIGGFGLIWRGWMVHDLARGSCFPSHREHAAKVRPLLNRRLAKIARTGQVRAGVAL